MSLDRYLEGLTKEAEQKRVEQVYLKTASIDELKSMLGMGKKASRGHKEKKAALNLGTISGAMEAGEGRRFPGAVAGTAGGLGGGALGGAAGGLLGSALGGMVGKPRAGALLAGIPSSLAGQWYGGKALGEVMKKPEAEKRAALRIGDAAGRILAKMAEAGSPAPIQLTGEELREAVQEAMARENIAGRARRWQTAGGALGAGIGAGAGGTLGHFVTKALGARSGLGAVAGGVGLGALGGMLGSSIGKREGAEEALADRIVSQMRANANMRRGAMMGYQAARGQSPFQGGR